MSELTEWLKERRNIHNEATEGPWYKTPNDRILSESVQWPEGDDYDVAGGLGRDGAVVEAIHDFDGNAIADAHNTLPALLTAVENVLEAIAQIDREYSKAPGENAYADADALREAGAAVMGERLETETEAGNWLDERADRIESGDGQ